MRSVAARIESLQERLASRIAARPFDAPQFLSVIAEPRIAAALDASGADAPADFTPVEREQFLAAAAFLDGLEKWHHPKTPKGSKQ